MKKLLCGALVALAVLAVGTMNAKNAAEPKTIETIMEEAHAGNQKSLRGKVISGKGTADEAKKLLALYEDLGKNKPPKGDAAAWKKKNDTIIAAAKKVAEKPDDAAATKALGTATACAGCHKDHKP
jgi:hypothetical protein